MLFFHTTFLLLAGLLGTSVSAAPTNNTYLSIAHKVANSMNDHYLDRTSGVYENQWWNSANDLTALADLAIIDPSFEATAQPIIHTAFEQAPLSQGIATFENAWYDDEGWWALLWISMYDLTKDAIYLNEAESLFKDMAASWPTPCGGGIWWDRAQTYIASIANELFLSVAAHLANRTPNRDDKASYTNWAMKEVDWFDHANLINEFGDVIDGIDLNGCTRNHTDVFTYNQGVILGGLVELSKATGDASLLPKAQAIADAAIRNLTNTDGILLEKGTKDQGAAFAQFKGIFIRNLQQLHSVAPKPSYANFIRHNADSIINNAMNHEDYLIAPNWQGPFRDPNMGAQGAGLDALVSAASLSNKRDEVPVDTNSAGRVNQNPLARIRDLT
ncbi:glycoside hydrolase family 76 protein [Viridothelium virens]|uniref:Glycoside hydrolase family 76 protein n=1 Tax=Viridothelium virens TaxID=1048519 RepID=A0A6A6HF63_VIRVR|nr:glycoside hydrolase family 76 protein [Viridothelium virens]